VPRSLSTAEIVGKNRLADTKSWTLLAEISITGKKLLSYDGSTANFNIGSRITGEDSGARARILDDSASAGATAGTLTLYDVRGEFQDNETITDNWSTIGSGVVDGAIGSTDYSYRYARSLETVSWSTAAATTWTRRAIDLETAGQSGQGGEAEVVIRIDDTDATDGLTLDLHRCNGLRGEKITLRYIRSDNATANAAITEEYIIADHAAGVGGMNEWSLITEEAAFQGFPRRTYHQLRCPFQYKSTLTCQDASSYTTCGRTLPECVTRGNEINFGGFPGIPGEEFE